ncbi:MAG: hypothetical protein U9O98_03185 [Asgard group archaeon]|nr:hypothetical protein [Asgard group archaeon]
MNDVILQDNLVFVAVNWGGLAIFNISDPSSPVLIGTYQESYETLYASDLTNGVFVEDDIAFVAAGKKGLLILNISNPYHPVKIAQHNENDICYQLVYANQLVYAKFGYNRLIVLNVTNLKSPVKIHEETFNALQELSIQNNLLFIITPLLFYPCRSYIINVSNPLTFDILHVLNTTVTFSLNQDFFCMLDDSNRFIVYDIDAFPSLVVLVNYSLPLHETAHYLCANNAYAYISSLDELLQVEITTPSDPEARATIEGLNWQYASAPYSVDRRFATPAAPTKESMVVFVDYQ